MLSQILVCFFICDKIIGLVIGNSLTEQNNSCIVHALLSELKLPLKHIYWKVPDMIDVVVDSYGILIDHFVKLSF